MRNAPARFVPHPDDPRDCPVCGAEESIGIVFYEPHIQYVLAIDDDGTVVVGDTLPWGADYVDHLNKVVCNRCDAKWPQPESVRAL